MQSWLNHLLQILPVVMAAVFVVVVVVQVNRILTGSCLPQFKEKQLVLKWVASQWLIGMADGATSNARHCKTDLSLKAVATHFFSL